MADFSYAPMQSVLAVRTCESLTQNLSSPALAAVISASPCFFVENGQPVQHGSMAAAPALRRG